MKSIASRGVALLALFVFSAHARPAQAQGSEPPGFDVSPPGSVRALPESSTCRMGDHDGIADSDAATAVRLVCADLAHAGAPAGVNYRVSVGKLGSLVILTLAREGDAPGTVADSREMRLRNIEEVSVAGPRLADSLVKGTTVTETERVDNLVGEETRKYGSKPGSVHFALGLVGLFPPLDQGAAPVPGADLDVHYETPSFELGGAMRFGGGRASSASPQLAYYMASVGGAYFLNDQDVSPYVGGGLSWEVLSLSVPGGFDGGNNGLAAYVSAGVQVLRTHHAHLALGLRLDIPFFALNPNSEYACTYATPASLCGAPANRSYFYMPIEAEVRLTF